MSLFIEFDDSENHWLPYAGGVVCSTGEVVTTLTDYLKTEHWKTLRKAARKLHKKGGCLCGRPKVGRLEYHHCTYKRVGNELPTDLVFLCRECHQLAHDLCKHNYSMTLREATYKAVEQNKAQPVKAQPVKEVEKVKDMEPVKAEHIIRKVR